MKILQKTVFVLMIVTASWGHAAVYNSSWSTGFQGSGYIPDDNVTGLTDARSISGVWGKLASLTVTLQISGGYNGDLYGYISFNNVLVPLLNRPGVTALDTFGYEDSGLYVKFSDSGAANIRFYQQVSNYDITSGTTAWKPDGRDVSPFVEDPLFESAGNLGFSLYNNISPNGQWTLFLADVQPGGGTPQLMSWGLSIETVPEPINLGLGAFAGSLLAFGIARRFLAKRQG